MARKSRDQDNGGLTLPAGFCASVCADNLGRAPHLTAAPTGDVCVNTWSSSYTELKNAPGGYLVVLNLASENPCLQQRSLTGIPASASRRNPTICASVNRFFIVRPLSLGRTLNQNATQNRGTSVMSLLAALQRILEHNPHLTP
jgi:hypothetical protein